MRTSRLEDDQPTFTIDTEQINSAPRIGERPEILAVDNMDVRPQQALQVTSFHQLLRSECRPGKRNKRFIGHLEQRHCASMPST